MMALARKIVSGDKEDETMEEMLVDDGWKLVEMEPETIGVNGNGHHANGNGHAPVPVNGRHEGANEPQQSLFSWADFMAEEPLKPKGRKSKPQPASLSMFERAMEQEREKETVGLSV